MFNRDSYMNMLGKLRSGVLKVMNRITADINNNNEDTDDFYVLEWHDKSTQTEACLPITRAVGIIENGRHERTVLTEEIHIDINTNLMREKNKTIDSMQKEIEFLKSELVNKDDTMKSLIGLFKSNLDMTKELSLNLLDGDFGYETCTTQSDSKHSNYSSDLYEQFVLIQRRTFDGDVVDNTPLTSTTYDIFIDSLEE